MSFGLLNSRKDGRQVFFRAKYGVPLNLALQHMIRRFLSMVHIVDSIRLHIAEGGYFSSVGDVDDINDILTALCRFFDPIQYHVAKTSLHTKFVDFSPAMKLVQGNA